jgi:hypothetical protein
LAIQPELNIEQQAQSFQIAIREELTRLFSELPELAMMQAQATALVEQAQAMEVTDAGAYSEARDQVLALKSVDECIAEIIHPYTEKAFKLHRTLTAIERNYREAGQAEAERLKRAMSAWSQAQEQARRAEELRLSEEARQREQNRLVAEAALAERDGRQGEAEYIFAEAMTVTAPPVVMPKATPILGGTSQRSVWKYEAETINKATLNPDFLTIDHKAIGAVVRTKKGQAARMLGGATVDGQFIPAVKVWEDKTTIIK